MAKLTGRRVLLVIARSGFREEELEAPRRALRRAGAAVTLAASTLEPCQGMAGGRAFPDLLHTVARAEDYDAVVFVGGRGALELQADRAAHALARAALRGGRLVAAICQAASILAEAGLLAGRRATAWPEREAHLRERGAVWEVGPLVRDGQLLTARGPEESEAFAGALVEALTAAAAR